MTGRHIRAAARWLLRAAAVLAAAWLTLGLLALAAMTAGRP